MSSEQPTPPSDFIRDIVADDLRTGKWGGRVITRFPPEPNGYLHIGHAKSITLNFSIALENGGTCHLRFDDTNPAAEDPEYVEAIKRDVAWLGFDWGEHLYHASDYFPQLYQYAVQLVKAGKAYVCSQSEADIRAFRGTVTEAGRPSPFRSRPIEESLALLEGMRRGDFPDGAHTLRASIDMASPNMKMRDPLIYRIRNLPHHHAGDAWHIYPLYDFAHCLSDSIERITHSLCTLEFENNRELYDWYLDALGVYHPQQIEFARLKLANTVMSKRTLLRLVQEGHVSGWDDPRMPTIAGLRRRGFTAASIRHFSQLVGLAKRDSVVDLGKLEFAVREDLNLHAPRVMAVLRPLRLVIDNYPDGKTEDIEAVNNPEDPAAGTRQIGFSRELFIEEDDFREDPPKKYFRLSPGREVRLKHAYYVTCTSVEKNPATGRVHTVHCRYDPETRGGAAPDGRSPKGTLHWVSARDAVAAEVHLYDNLFKTEDPAEISDDFAAHLNPGSLEVLKGALVEPRVAASEPGDSFQFMRQGYFCRDISDGLVFNRTVGLRDSWGKLEKKAGDAPDGAAS